MKVNELSKELNITNKDLISYFKSKGYSVSSHLQPVTDEMANEARQNFTITTDTTEVSVEETPVIATSKKKIPAIPTKTYQPTDMIPCRSIVPWKLCEIGLDQVTVYFWGSYGDVEYVSYRDLQAFKRKDIIKESKIIIEDEDLCLQWSRELGETYKKFLTVSYPEEFFDLNDRDFENLLKNAPLAIKNVIKYTAMNMIRNENYPTLQKINIIDSALGTCIKEFI